MFIFTSPTIYQSHALTVSGSASCRAFFIYSQFPLKNLLLSKSLHWSIKSIHWLIFTSLVLIHIINLIQQIGVLLIMSEKIKEFRKRWIKPLFGFVDIIATITTLLFAVWFTNKFTNELVTFDQEFIIVVFTVSITWLILLKATNLARIPRTSAIPVIIADFMKLTLLGGFIIFLLDWIIKLDNFPSLTLGIFIVFNFFALVIIRLILFRVFKKFRANGHNIRNLVIIANGSHIALIDKITAQKEWGYKILHIITDSEIIKEKYQKSIKIHPRQANIKSLIRFDIIDEFICCDSELDEQKFFDLVEYCQSLGVIVRTTARFTANKKNLKCRVQYFDRMPLLTFECTPIANFEHAIKNILEIATAFTILFVLSPLLVTVSLMVALTSKGPIVFKQERVGLRGRKFYIYKFRTMVQNAEELKQKLIALNESDGPTFKIKKDPRITTIGRFLRKTNLDEIPQLLNVIKGEMSIIGPRPPLQSEVDQYKDWQLKRLSVKPGLTCTWQIVPNRNEVKFDRWVEMDIQYIENWTLKSDIELFFKTFKTVLLARGA